MMSTVIAIGVFVVGFAIGTGVTALIAALMFLRRDEAAEFTGDAFPVDGRAGR